MKKIHIMVGLPRSGKSTKARQLGYPIVNPDSIRLVLHGTPFRKEAEPLVWSIAHTMVEALFNAGHDDVILDATNVSPYRRKEWKSDKWVRMYHVMAANKDLCIARAKA